MRNPESNSSHVHTDLANKADSDPYYVSGSDAEAGFILNSLTGTRVVPCVQLDPEETL